MAVDQAGCYDEAGHVDRPDGFSLQGRAYADDFAVPYGDVGTLIHAVCRVDHPSVPQQEVILNAAHVLLSSVQSSTSAITSNSQAMLLFGRLCVPITVRA